MSVRGSREKGTTESARTGRRWSRVSRFFLATHALAALAACSLAVDAGRNQCTADADCTIRLGPTGVCNAGTCKRAVVDAGPDVEVDAAVPDPAWDCLETTPAQTPADRLLNIFARYQRVDGTPLDGLSVSACVGIGTCDALSGTPKPTDADGLFTITYKQSVSGGFRGNLQSPGVDGGVLPSILLVQPGETNTQSLEPVGDGRPRYPTQLLTAADLASYASALGESVTVNPEAGHAMILGLDCQRDTVVDATITLDAPSADTRTLYFDDDGKPNKDLKKTSKVGRALILNITSGRQNTFNLIRADGLRVVNPTIFVGKGVVSYGYFAPTISPVGL